MNFLELCRRVRQECGISSTGSGPSSVTSQSGEMKRVVDWTASAYEDICAAHTRWKFLRSSFSFNTVAGTAAYLPAVVTDTNDAALIVLAKWAEWLTGTFRIYLASAGVSTEQEIYPTEDWEEFRYRWLRGTLGNQRPGTFGIRPQDNAIVLGGTPDAIYTVRGDYMRTAPALLLDADIPLIPGRFHMSIVWAAIQKYATFQENGGLYDVAGRQFNRINGNLEIDQLPGMGPTEPLA